MKSEESRHIFKSPAEQIKAAVASKEDYDRKRKSLSYKEKLNIVVKLQEKAFFMGKTKVKPWPIS